MTSALGKLAYRSPVDGMVRRNAKRGLAVNPSPHENSLFSSAHGFIRGDTWHQATTPVLHLFFSSTMSSRRWGVRRWFYSRRYLALSYYSSYSLCLCVVDASPSVGKALTCLLLLRSRLDLQAFHRRTDQSHS
jgi:hypothetical protein